MLPSSVRGNLWDWYVGGGHRGRNIPLLGLTTAAFVSKFVILYLSSIKKETTTHPRCDYRYRSTYPVTVWICCAGIVLVPQPTHTPCSAIASHWMKSTEAGEKVKFMTLECVQAGLWYGTEDEIPPGLMFGRLGSCLG